MPVLILFAVAGMMLLISAGSLVMVYLGLELLALCSYALVAIDRDSPTGSEAAMKYFVLGALASGMLLYGMSLVYGATGSIDLATIRVNASLAAQPAMLLTGVAFMVAGIAFKFGAAPFHMWLPDVYHGAPTPITLFIGSAPKLAAFAMAIRLLEVGAAPLGDYWHPMLAGLAALSLVIGNLVALAQTNLKRMLAYSTVSARRLPVHGPGRRRPGRVCGGDVLRAQLRGDGGRRVRRDHRAVAPRLRGRPHRRFQGAQRPRPVDRRPGAVRDGVAGGRAAVPRLLGQAGGAARGARGRFACGWRSSASCAR